MDHELNIALKNTGFEICLFPPEDGEACEKCKKDNIQLYFQGPTDAGRYYCKECIIEEYLINCQTLQNVKESCPACGSSLFIKDGEKVCSKCTYWKG